MKNLYSSVTCGAMDVHYKFSNVTFRDKAGKVVRRESNYKQQSRVAFMPFFTTADMAQCYVYK